MASKVLNLYGTCMMQVQDFKARYFYMDDNYVWVEVDYELL